MKAKISKPAEYYTSTEYLTQQAVGAHPVRAPKYLANITGY